MRKWLWCASLVLLISMFIKFQGLKELNRETEKTLLPGEVKVVNYDSNLNSHAYYYSVPPKRIIALWQNSVETLLALGEGNRIIAAGGISNIKHLSPVHQSLYLKIPVHSNRVLSKEEMLLLQPDFILGWLYDFADHGSGIGTSFFWEKHGVNVYMNLMDGAEFKAIHTIEDEYKYITDIGNIVGKPRESERIILETKKKIDAYKIPNFPKKLRVLVIASVTRELVIYTPRTLPGNVVEVLGGEMLGKEQESIGENEIMSFETLRMLDPDVILIQVSPETAKNTISRFYKLPITRDLKSVRKRQVYGIPFFLLRNPGARIEDTVVQIGESLKAAQLTQTSTRSSK